MRKVSLIAPVLLLVVGLAVAGEVRVVVAPSGGELQESVVSVAPGPEQTLWQPDKTAEIHYKAWLPYFVVDTSSPSGINTLFAVRNRSAGTISITYRYYPTSYAYSEAVIVTETLAPRQTRTVSIRDVPGIPVDPATGLKTGVVEIEEDSMSGYISGDWFLLDSANNYASGDRLISFDSFCHSWDSRYLHGGAFSGGTTFTFFLGSNLSGGTSPIVVGHVYDEAGNLGGTVQLYTPNQAFEVNTADLPQHIISAAGTIEWEIQNAYTGYVHTTFRAFGKYSAGLPSMCVDNALAVR
jgi:hypothetical protein